MESLPKLTLIVLASTLIGVSHGQEWTYDSKEGNWFVEKLYRLAKTLVEIGLHRLDLALAIRFLLWHLSIPATFTLVPTLTAVHFIKFFMPIFSPISTIFESFAMSIALAPLCYVHCTCSIVVWNNLQCLQSRS